MANQSESTPSTRMYRIDRYTVPKASLSEFLVNVRKIQAFLGTLEGMVQHFVIEKEAGPDAVNLVTVAEWDSVESIRKAIVKVKEMHDQSGYDRGRSLSRLGIVAELAEYKPLAD